MGLHKNLSISLGHKTIKHKSTYNNRVCTNVNENKRIITYTKN